MNGSHFDKQTQHERTCSLIHGTWRCAGVRIASVGACALMVGQLLLPSVALATECADPAAAMGEVAAAPVTPAVTEDTAATTAPAASTAPVTDAAPAAQATVEPQQTIPADAANESSGAALAGQNASGDDNAAMPASNAIMPCGVTDVVGGSDVRVNTTVVSHYTNCGLPGNSRSKRVSRTPMIFPMLRAACRMSRSANLSKPSTTGPMLLRAPWLKSRTHLCPM